MKPRRWFQFALKKKLTVLAALLGAALLFHLLFLSHSGHPVEFVVPTGFRGTVEVIKDSRNGQDVEFKRARYVITVPPSGIVRLKDATFFHRWHAEIFRDEKGRPRQAEDLGSTAGQRRTGPNSFEHSSDMDGTTYRWEVR